MRNDFVRLSVLAVLIAAGGLGALVAEAADHEFSYEECTKDFGLSEVLQDSCREWGPYPEGECLTLPPWNNTLSPNDHPEHECTFRFWTWNDEVYLPEDLPAEICTPAKETTAVAWFTCSKECVGDDCDKQVAGNTLVAIDAADGEVMSDAFIASVKPAGAEGSCSTKSPCRTTATLAEATAKLAAGGRGFIRWIGRPAGAVGNASPASPDVAFYGGGDEEDEPCALLLEINDWVVACKVGPIDWGRFELWADRLQYVLVDDLCRYVLDCPGCGPSQQCNPWLITADTDQFHISLHDVATGKLIVAAQPRRDGSQQLRFTPRGTDRPGAGYVLVFRPVEARAGTRVAVEIGLTVPR